MDLQGASKQQRRGKGSGREKGKDGRELAALNLLCGLFRCLTDPKTEEAMISCRRRCHPTTLVWPKYICSAGASTPWGMRAAVAGGRVSKTITTYWFLLYVLHYSCHYTAKTGKRKSKKKQQAKEKTEEKPKQKQQHKQRGPSGIFSMF